MAIRKRPIARNISSNCFHSIVFFFAFVNRFCPFFKCFCNFFAEAPANLYRRRHSAVFSVTSGTTKKRGGKAVFSFRNREKPIKIIKTRVSFLYFCAGCGKIIKNHGTASGDRTPYEKIKRRTSDV